MVNMKLKYVEVSYLFSFVLKSGSVCLSSYMCARGQCWASSSIVLHLILFFFFFFWDRISHQTWSSHSATMRWGSNPQRPCLCLCSAGIAGALHTGAESLKSGPHAGTEPPPQPPKEGFKDLFIFYFMGMSVLCTCNHMHHVYAWYPQRPEEGFRSPELELLTVEGRHVGAGNRILCKSSKYF